MRGRGFTLIELVVALGCAALLVAMALPALQDRLAVARRGDATQALQRLQVAQERHRAAHGLYASELGRLGGGTLSGEGLYRVELQTGPGDTYVAVARARPDGAQAHDTACAEITLRVELGFATLGPSLRCWNR
jgi:type II secretory pathway pseudopilin PulG